MFVKVGPYTHPINECNLRRMEIRHRLSPRRKRLTKIVTLYLEGSVYGDSQSELTTKIGQLIDAYQDDYQEVGLYEDDGNGGVGQRTPHFVHNEGSISGVKILGRNWPKGDGGQYANQRYFSITAMSEYADVETELVYWEDSVKIIGTGGRLREVYQTPFGPREVITATRTPVRIIRSGEAIGFQAWIDYPGPLFPQIEDEHLREEQRTSGQNQGLLNCFRHCRWTYYHTSLAPVSDALPELR